GGGPDPAVGRAEPDQAREEAEAAAAAHVMPSAVVLSAVRTPVGRYGGALAGVRPDDLAGVAIAAAVERAGIAPDEIEDVYFGCANQAGEGNRHLAPMGVLLGRLAPPVPR